MTLTYFSYRACQNQDFLSYIGTDTAEHGPHFDTISINLEKPLLEVLSQGPQMEITTPAGEPVTIHVEVSLGEGKSEGVKGGPWVKEGAGLIHLNGISFDSAKRRLRFNRL